MSRTGRLALLAAVLPAAGLPAQTMPDPLLQPQRSAAYLVTFGPGGQVWERFGHNALLFRDTVSGASLAYDFGRFDFGKPGFLVQFARGHTDYWMGRADGLALIDLYARNDRSIWLQALDLSTAQVGQLRDSLEAALARDQGTYRYHYYRDNCSTRIRDAIDLVTGGAVRRQLDADTTALSYRDHTRRALAYRFAFYAPVMAALGPATDRPVTAWEASFLPVQLMTHLREVTVTGPAGAERPLVSGEAQLAVSGVHVVPDETPAGPSNLMLRIGVGVAALLTLLGMGGARRAGLRWAFLALAGLWELVVGVVALLLIWFWGFSDHDAAYRNANLLHFTLVGFLFLAMLPGMIRGDVTRLRLGLFCARFGAVVSLLGALVAVTGVTGQAMGDVTALAFPIHAAVVVGLTLLVRARTTPWPS